MTNISDTDPEVTATTLPVKKKKYTGKPAQPKVNSKTKKDVDQETERTDPSPQPDRRAKDLTKQKQLVDILKQSDGESIAQLCERFGWLPHSTRAALTRLRQTRHAIERSTSNEGISIYRIA